ncbi:MAG: hypothetical protein JXB88_26380 [Spirochaetales bacterium]|nr:hypothetical protein [Spirochaetales bacterium]
MNTITRCLLLCLLTVSIPFYGTESDDITLTISFYQKKIYYLAQSDIFINISLTNNSSQTYRFKAATNKFFNLDFEVKTITNLVLDHAETFITQRNEPEKHVFFREVSLEPGEEYGFVVELNDFAAFENAGIYTVQAIFYPELLKHEGSAGIRSNKLTLSLRPPVVLKEMQAVIDAETGETLKPQPLPPDEVVAYMLHARQRSQWEKFFLYIDLESLLLQNPSRAARYKKLSHEGREEMLLKFREEMMQEKIEDDMLIIPRSFEIQETTYTQERGSVIVLEYFDYRDYTEKKMYTYYVKKNDKYWLVVGYTLRSIGTE